MLRICLVRITSWTYTGLTQTDWYCIIGDQFGCGGLIIGVDVGDLSQILEVRGVDPDGSSQTGCERVYAEA